MTSNNEEAFSISSRIPPDNDLYDFGQTGGTKFATKIEVTPEETEREKDMDIDVKPASPDQSQEKDEIDKPSEKKDKKLKSPPSNKEEPGDLTANLYSSEVEYLRSKAKNNAKKRFLIYPENNYLAKWDFLMTFVLIMTCIITPTRIAFFKTDEDEEISWVVFNALIDFLFFLDILAIFNTAYYDEYFQIEDDRKVICKRYFSGWFFIDLLAVIPFDHILNATELH